MVYKSRDFRTTSKTPDFGCKMHLKQDWENVTSAICKYKLNHIEILINDIIYYIIYDIIRFYKEYQQVVLRIL